MLYFHVFSVPIFNLRGATPHQAHLIHYWDKYGQIRRVLRCFLNWDKVTSSNPHESSWLLRRFLFGWFLRLARWFCMLENHEWGMETCLPRVFHSSMSCLKFSLSQTLGAEGQTLDLALAGLASPRSLKLISSVGRSQLQCYGFWWLPAVYAFHVLYQCGITICVWIYMYIYIHMWHVYCTSACEPTCTTENVIWFYLETLG